MTKTQSPPSSGSTGPGLSALLLSGGKGSEHLPLTVPAHLLLCLVVNVFKLELYQQINFKSFLTLLPCFLIQQLNTKSQLAHGLPQT